MSAAAFKKRVGRLIRSAREAAGLRQDDVAARVGETVTKSLLSRYETGAVLPRIERLRALLGACGLSPRRSRRDTAPWPTRSPTATAR